MATETQLTNIIRGQNNRISKLEERLEQTSNFPMSNFIKKLRSFFFNASTTDSPVPVAYNSEDNHQEVNTLTTSFDLTVEGNFASNDDCLSTFHSQPRMSPANVEMTELKDNQRKLMKHLENCNDSRDRRTVVVSNIGLEAWAVHLGKNNMDNWPFIKRELRARGLDFLLTDCVDMRVSKTGTLYVTFDRYSRVRYIKQMLRWRIHNIKKDVEQGKYPACKMKFTEKTPARFNGTRRILQKKATDLKRRGLIDTFEFVISRSEGGDKMILLKVWSRRTLKYYYFDTNQQILIPL